MEDKNIIVYTLETCPNCLRVKTFLKEKGLAFTEKRMDDPESMTHLNILGYIPMAAPVMEYNGKIFLSTEIFMETIKHD